MSGDGHRKLSESNNDVKPKTIEPVSKAGCGCENLNFSSLLVLVNAGGLTNSDC